MRSSIRRGRGMGREESGFALIAALLAVWVLTAVGVLVFTVTTQDVRVSSRAVGEKRAFYATEAGVHVLTQGFDPLNLGASERSDEAVDPTDGSSRYTIGTPGVPTKGPGAIPIVGYSEGGGQSWGSTRFVATVTGTNTRYGSTVQVSAGVGYGPVEVTTTYR
jgi:Tfp pilus assembly protein PilX